MNNHYRSFSQSPRSARDTFFLTPSRDRKSFTALILAFGKFHNGLIMTLRSAGFKHFLSSNAHWHIYYTTIKLIKSFMLLEKKKTKPNPHENYANFLVTPYKVLFV